MPSKHTQQQGFTLFLSMIFLVILTIIGLTSMQGTRTEMAMAGNLRESDISFQSAETGLIAAETFAQNATSKTNFNDSNGLVASTTLDPDYYDAASWSGVQTANTSLSNVYAQPNFIIKYLGDRAQHEVAAVNIGGYGSAQPGKVVSNFRVTTRGYGQTQYAVTMLQSYYGKEF